MLGLGISLARGFFVSVATYVQDNLRLFFRFKGSENSPISHASTGSTSFDGDDYIDTTYVLESNIFTISYWINITEDSNYHYHFSARDASNDGVVVFSSNTDQKALTAKFNSISTTFSVGSYNTWYYISIVNNGTDFRAYVDGVQTGTPASTSSQTISVTTTTKIGSNESGSNYFTKGSFANFAIWERTLSASEVQGIMYKQYSDLGNIDKTNLVSWWGLDVDYTDSHGSNDGTNSGSTLNATVYGNNAPQIPRILDVATPKQAVQLSEGSTDFNGTSDYVTISSSASSNWTLSTWAKADFTDSNWHELYDQATSGGRITIAIVSNTFKMYDTGYRASSYTLSDTNWHHYAITQSGTDLRFYVDGIAEGSATSNGTSMGGDAHIGRYYPSASEYWEGSMANYAIHSSALTQSQVQELMFTEKYAGLSADLKTNLVSWYDMGETSLGSEMVTNGTFDTDYSGWSLSGATAEVRDEQLVLTSTNANGRATQSITFDANKTYQLTVDNISSPLGGAYAEVKVDHWLTDGAESYDDGSDDYARVESGKKLTRIFKSSVSGDKDLKLTDGSSGATSVHTFDNASIKEYYIPDSHGSNHGYPPVTSPINTGYTSSPHGVVDPINYGTLHSGTALSFDGVNDYVDTGSTFQSTFRGSHSVSCWIKPTDGQPSSQGRLFGSKNSPPDDWQYFSVNTNGKVGYVFESNENSASAETDEVVFANGTVGWAHIVAVLDSTIEGVGGIKIYVNGELASSGDGDTTSVVFSDYTSADEVFIGAQDSNGSPADEYAGLINGLKIFNSALTLSEIQEMYLNPEQILPTGVSSSNLALHLQMNEGDGDYTYDGSGNQNHGTISGATWVKTETDTAQVGIVRQNKPMVFDGSNDYIDLGNAFKDWTNAPQKTLSIWVMNGGNTTIGARIFNVGYDDSSAKTALALGVDNGTDNKPYYFLRNTSGASLKTEFGSVMDVGRWYHFVIVQDGANDTAYLYQDGALEATVSSVGEITQTTNQTAKIGKHWDSGASGNFKGLTNEVAIWDEALTSSEVTALYNSGTPLDASADSGDYASSIGLQGYWRNDNDTTWTDRANTGVASFDGVDDYVALFDSEAVHSDFQGMGNSNDYSIFCWINTTGGTSVGSGWRTDDTIIELRNEASSDIHVPFSFGVSDGVLELGRTNDGNTGQEREQGAITVNDGAWHFVGFTIDNNAYSFYVDGDADSSGSFTTATGDCSVSSAVSNMLVGVRSKNTGAIETNFFEGKISSLGIFDIALTSTEVSELYAIDKRSSISGHSQFGNCVGSWLMGAGSGDTTSTIQDQTTNNNDATVSGAKLVGYNDGTVSGSPDSIVLTEGLTSGRDSQGFYLTDTTENCLTLNDAEYVSASATIGVTHTFACWIKLATGTGGDNIRMLFDWTGNSLYYGYRNDKLYSYDYSSSAVYGDTTLTTGQWYHIAFVRNDTSGLTYYVNGSADGTADSVSKNWSGSFTIGGRGSYLHDGKIDDVRIYSQELSASEVLNNYNVGLSKHS